METVSVILLWIGIHTALASLAGWSKRYRIEEYDPEQFAERYTIKILMVNFWPVVLVIFIPYAIREQLTLKESFLVFLEILFGGDL